MSKRLPNLASPFAKVQQRISRYTWRPFRNLSIKTQFWLGFSLLVLVTTFLIFNPFVSKIIGETYQDGEIVRQTIISPADISAANDEETENLKRVAQEAVRPIFTFEPNRAEQAVQIFRASWEQFRKKADSLPTKNSNAAANTAKTDSIWNGVGGAEVGKVFNSRKFSNNELDAITRALRESADGSVYDDKDALNLKNEIMLIDRQKPNQQSIASLPESSMTKLSIAREKFNVKLKEIQSLAAKEVDAFDTALSSLIQPSVVFDSVATENARQMSLQNLPTLKTELKRGQVVAREGDTITPEISAKINAIRSYASQTRQLNRFFGILFFVMALYWIAWKYIDHRGSPTRAILSAEKTFALVGLVIVVQTFLMRICFSLAEYTAAQNFRAPLNDPTIWSLAIPFAFASLLITVLADRKIALFIGLATAFIGGLLAPRGLEFAIFGAVSSATAVYGIGQYRTRQSVTIAGALVGLVNIGAALALIGFLQMPIILSTVLLAIGCSLLGGLITSAVTSIFSPLCESLFGILTDVKLLELSNSDLPVLSQMALRTPGTNQHSHAVGQLSQEACRAVGANPLLARIGALYHDIGKLAAPEHFVENQLGKNPHDRLRPSQSAKIIISHVSYGIKLAKEIGLPNLIIDFIPQHHGTRTLHYFLRKAQNEAEDETIDENEFRYPGPKPQFKEAAIMMIADSCEAAARSLAHPNPENVRFIVTKIIDAILSDDQLDECDLTLRELTLIRESMIKSLVAIYHSRIEYPGYSPEKLPAADVDSEERGMKYVDPAEIPISKGGEIEDEAIFSTKKPLQPKKKTAE